MIKKIVIFLILFLPYSSFANELIEETIPYAGTEREFIVYLPNSYQASKHKKKFPLVIALHGGGGNGRQFMESSKMNDAAEKHGFIVVYPNGSGFIGNKLLSWNAMDCCGYAVRKGVNDVAFIGELIDYLILNYRINSEKVFVTGHSNGGRLAYLLACLMPDKIKAVHANAISAPDYMILNYCGHHKVSILHTHGALDKCIPFFGADTCGGCLQDFFTFNGLKLLKNANDSVCYNVPNSLGAIRKNYNCQKSENISLTKNVICSMSSNCENNTKIGLCVFQDAGHTWAGGEYGEVCNNENSYFCNKFKKIVGEINHDINLNDLMWGFFKSF